MFSKNVKISILDLITLGLIALLTFGCLWAILEQPLAFEPNGSIFALFIIYMFSYLAGELSSLINLPPLIGMLLTDVLFGNIFSLNFHPKLSSILRSFALAIILLRAGLSLDSKVLKKLTFVCLRLSFVPCIVEATTIAITSYFLLDFSLTWGFLLGFVLSAISPAVVVPGMLLLQERNFGTDKGIPTLIIAAASIDDVVAITFFGVFLTIVFDTRPSLSWSFIKGPFEALIGLIFGSLLGVFLWYLPHQHDQSNANFNNLIKYQRSVLLILSGIFTLFASSVTGLGGSGAFGCLTLAFLVGIKWRNLDDFSSAESSLKFLWLLFQPFLFSLIGIEVKLSNLQGPIGLSLVVLFIGLLFRALLSMIVVWGAKFNIKKRIFIGLAWIPKATVQTAIGPLALDMARKTGDKIMIERSSHVLTIAVLSILITAPLGALLVTLTAPKLLNNENKNMNNKEEIKEQQKEENV